MLKKVATRTTKSPESLGACEGCGGGKAVFVGGEGGDGVEIAGTGGEEEH